MCDYWQIGWGSVRDAVKSHGLRKRLPAFIALVVLLLWACPAPAQEDGFTLQDTTLLSYSTDEMPLYVQNVGAKGIHAELQFDPTLIRVIGFFAEQGKVDTVSQYYDYIDGEMVPQNDHISFIIADTAAFTDGVLMRIVIEPIAEVDTTTQIVWTRIETDDSTQYQARDGTIFIKGTSVADLNRDGVEDERDVDVLIGYMTSTPVSLYSQFQPLWWLMRANVREDYLDDGYPKLTIGDVVDMLARIN